MKTLSTTLCRLFFIFPFLLAWVSLHAADVAVNGVIYHIENGEARVVGVEDRKIREAAIADEIDGCPVTGIGYTWDEIEDWAPEGYPFMCCFNLSRVTLPKNLKIIGEGAFLYCHSLSSITLPDGVESIWWGGF